MTIRTPEAGFRVTAKGLFEETRIKTTNGFNILRNTANSRVTVVSMPNSRQINVTYSSIAGEGITEPFVAGITMYQSEAKYGRHTYYYEVQVVLGGETFWIANNRGYGIQISRGERGAQYTTLESHIAQRKIDSVAIKAAVDTWQHPDFSQIVTRRTLTDAKAGIFN